MRCRKQCSMLCTCCCLCCYSGCKQLVRFFACRFNSSALSGTRPCYVSASNVLCVHMRVLPQGRLRCIRLFYQPPLHMLLLCFINPSEFRAVLLSLYSPPGAVYTYDAIGSHERTGYSCQGSFINRNLTIPWPPSSAVLPYLTRPRCCVHADAIGSYERTGYSFQGSF
jgi:hypothetical protein